MGLDFDNLCSEKPASVYLLALVKLNNVTLFARWRYCGGITL